MKIKNVMEFTGERYVPTVHGTIELEHMHRYLFARQAVLGKSILDIASGEGYGSALLSGYAKNVIGVDISAQAIEHAEQKYRLPNLTFIVGSCSKIPVNDSSIDVVISFETIEHHHEHDDMMLEIKRVLRPGGLLIISSPDKLEFTDKTGEINPHHVKELYKQEFETLLAKNFSNVSPYGQRVIFGSAIFSEDSATSISTMQNEDANFVSHDGVAYPLNNLAIASDAEIPKFDSSFLEQKIENADLTKFWESLISERDLTIDGLHNKVGARDKAIEELNNLVSEQVMQIQALKKLVGVGKKT